MKNLGELCKPWFILKRNLLSKIKEVQHQVKKQF